MRSTQSTHAIRTHSRTKHTLKEVAIALRCADGMQTHAAKYLGCTYRTLQNYMNRWPELRNVVFEAKEKTLDLSENKLFQSVRKGNIQAIMFHLKTQGKERGYVERAEDEGPRVLACQIVLPADFPQRQLTGTPSPLPKAKHPILPPTLDVEYVSVSSSKSRIEDESKTSEPSVTNEPYESKPKEPSVIVSRAVPVRNELEEHEEAQREFLRKQTEEIWIRSAPKMRTLLDVPRPYELELVS